MVRIKTIAEKLNCGKSFKFVLMRLAGALCLLFLFNSSVFAYAQRPITLKIKDVDMATAISAVEKISDYRFVLNNNVLPEKKVDLNFRDADLPEVMNQLLAKTTLSYKVMENNLIVIYNIEGIIVR